jgi:uncharacterized membrane protein
MTGGERTTYLSVRVPKENEDCKYKIEMEGKTDDETT